MSAWSLARLGWASLEVLDPNAPATLALEPVTAKGKSKPLQVYRILGYKQVGRDDLTRPHKIPSP